MKIAMTAADLTKYVAFGNCKVRYISGYNEQAAARYIQLFEIPPLAAGGITAATVPAQKSFTCATVAPFNFLLGEEGINLSELLVGISTTEANYTAPSANQALDLTLHVDSVYACNGAETVVGDQTTNQQTLQVWTEAAGALVRNRLLRVDVLNSDTAHTAYLDVYATDAMGASNLVVAHIPLKVPAAGTLQTVCNFGIEGISPFQQSAAYVKKYGCSLTVTGSTNCAIRAIYR